MEGTEKSLREQIKDGIINRLKATIISNEYEIFKAGYKADKETDKKAKAEFNLKVKAVEKATKEIEEELELLNKWK